jgi:hypothetical protein
MKETNKEKIGDREAVEQPNGMFEASPKTGYTLTMAWEVK